MSDTIDVNIRLDDHSTDYTTSLNTGWDRVGASLDVVNTPALRLTLRANDPGVLRDFGHALIDLADDLEVAQRPYVGDEDAERGAES